jgi:hypothetical protein
MSQGAVSHNQPQSAGRAQGTILAMEKEEQPEAGGQGNWVACARDVWDSTSLNLSLRSCSCSSLHGSEPLCSVQNRDVCQNGPRGNRGPEPARLS